jgi:hypothetical protein
MNWYYTIEMWHTIQAYVVNALLIGWLCISTKIIGPKRTLLACQAINILENVLFCVRFMKGGDVNHYIASLYDSIGSQAFLTTIDYIGAAILSIAWAMMYGFKTTLFVLLMTLCDAQNIAWTFILMKLIEIVPRRILTVKHSRVYAAIVIVTAVVMLLCGDPFRVTHSTMLETNIIYQHHRDITTMGFLVTLPIILFNRTILLAMIIVAFTRPSLTLRYYAIILLSQTRGWRLNIKIVRQSFVDA